MKAVKIICDGISNMPKELGQEYDIHVIPLTVNVDGVEYKESEITNQQFYKMMRDAKEIPKTSQATYVDFKEVFEKYINEGNAIVYISGSSRSSGTYQSAIIAKEDIDGEVYAFDSMNISFGCGMLVLEAAKMAQKGMSAKEILKELEVKRDEIYVTLALGSLEYLYRGGRISSGKAFIGNALNLKPVLSIRDGLIAPIYQVRGNKKLIPSIVNHIKEVCGSDLSDRVVAIGCGENTEDLDKLRELVKKELNPKELIEVTMSPAMTVHSGPNLIGITCFKK